MQDHRSIPGSIWLLCAVLLGLFVFQAYSEQLLSQVRIGVITREDGYLLNIISISPDSPAERAGIQPGSTLIAVNNHPITNITELIRTARSSQGRKIIHITVEKDGIPHTISLLPGMPMDYSALFLNLLILIFYISVGLASIRASGIHHDTVLLAWFSFIVALDITTYINIAYWGEALLVPFTLFKQELAVLQFLLLFHLLSKIPKPLSWLSWRHQPGLMYAGILGLHTFSTLLMLDILAPGSSLSQIADFAFNHNLPYISWGIIILILLLVQRYRASEPIHKQQIQWIIYSVIPWVLLQLSEIVATDANWVYSPGYNLLDKFIHLFFLFGIFTAVFRFNMLDLNDLFPHEYFYTLGTLLLLTPAGLLILGAANRISRTFNSELGALSGGLAMAALGYSFWPTRNWLIQFIEDQRWRRRSRLGHELRRLSQVFSTLDDPQDIQRYLTFQLATLLHCRKIVLDLNNRFGDTANPSAAPADDSHTVQLLPAEFAKELRNPLQLSTAHTKDPRFKRLFEQQFELIIPLHLNQDNIGYLLISRRLDKQPYNWREIELLNLFAQNIAAKLTNALLSNQVAIDELTGLYRRKAILEMLEQSLEKEPELAIAMIDLDNFKMVNDQHGHLAGDAVLTQAASAARHQLGKNDLLGRYGGEEFLLLMPKRNIVSAEQLCENIRQAIAALQHSNTAATTVSIGIATLEEISDHRQSRQKQMLELISIADRRLYQAKSRGKNQVVSGRM